MATNRRARATAKRKLSNAFNSFDFALAPEEREDSHSPADLGNHLDDMIDAKEEAARAKYRRELEMEAVLFYIEKKGHGFQDSICSYCELPFAHTYLGVAYCSEQCRAARLHELGIAYNINGKTEHERWNINNKGWMPKIIGPEAYQAIKMQAPDYKEEETTPPIPASLPEAVPDKILGT